MHAITVVAGTGGSIEPAGRDGVVSVADGASQTFTMIPESGYSIQSVFVDGQRSEAATATGQHIFTSVRRDHTISAAFNKRRYTLVVVASPADGGTTEGGGTIDHGDTVAIAATPSPGYYFGGWRKATGAAVIFGNTADYSTFVVLEQGDATVEARFTAYPAAAPPRVAPPRRHLLGFCSREHLVPDCRGGGSLHYRRARSGLHFAAVQRTFQCQGGLYRTCDCL
jgi:hypothetical protein